MLNPHGGGSSKESRNHGRVMILTFCKTTRKSLNECRYCGEIFAPSQSWHALCAKCFRGSRLYSAIIRYREVTG